MFSAVDEYREADERIEDTLLPSRYDSAYLWHYLLGVLLLLAAVGLFAVRLDGMAQIPWLAPAALTALSLLVLFWTELRRHFIIYHFTDRKLIKESGILDKTVETVHYDQITETVVSEELDERIFDVGDLHINTAGTDTTELMLNGVSHPERYKVLIDEHVSRHGERVEADPSRVDVTPSQLESELFSVRESKRELTQRYRAGELSEPSYRQQWYALDGKERLLERLLT